MLATKMALPMLVTTMVKGGYEKVKVEFVYFKIMYQKAFCITIFLSLEKEKLMSKAIILLPSCKHIDVSLVYLLC